MDLRLDQVTVAFAEIDRARTTTLRFETADLDGRCARLAAAGGASRGWCFVTPDNGPTNQGTGDRTSPRPEETTMPMSRTRLLLLTAGLLAAAAPAAGQCDPSAGFAHAAAVTDGDLRTVLAAGNAIYPAGAEVTFELIVTNVGEAPATIAWPVTHPDALMVTPPDCADVADCLGSWYFDAPPFLMYVPGEVTLAPGECRRRTIVWDTAADPAPVGPCLAHGGLFAWTVDVYQDPLGQWITPPGGVALDLEISEAVPAVGAAWSALKAGYR